MPSARNRATSAEKPHILVAEDNPINQMLISAVLQPLGFDVSVVEDGLAAVKACEADCFDLLILDLQMPVMSGLSAVRAIRARGGAQAQAPIVALTASTEPQSLDAGGDMSLFDAIMPKPFDREKLLALIDTLLSAAMPVKRPAR